MLIHILTYSPAVFFIWLARKKDLEDNEEKNDKHAICIHTYILTYFRYKINIKILNVSLLKFN